MIAVRWILLLLMIGLCSGYAGDEPPTPNRLLEIAAFREKIGDCDAAMDRYRRTLAHEAVTKPERAAAILGLIRCLIQSEKSAEARTLLEHHGAILAADKAGIETLANQLFPDSDTHGPHLHSIHRGSSSIHEKLDNVILPRISLEDAPLPVVLRYLRERSRDLDPDQEGINIVALDPMRDVTVTMDFDNIPIGEVIRYICNGSGLKYRVDPHAAVVSPHTIICYGMETVVYRVEPNFLETDAPSSSDGKSPARRFLESMGMAFPAGSGAAYLESADALIVTNAPDILQEWSRSFYRYDVHPTQLRIDCELVELPVGADFVVPAEAADGLWSRRRDSGWRSLNQISVMAMNGVSASASSTQVGRTTSLVVKSDVRPDGYTSLLHLDWRHGSHSLESTFLTWDGETMVFSITPEDATANIGQRLLIVTPTMLHVNGRPMRRPE